MPHASPHDNTRKYVRMGPVRGGGDDGLSPLGRKKKFRGPHSLWFGGKLKGKKGGRRRGREFVDTDSGGHRRWHCRRSEGLRSDD